MHRKKIGILLCVICLALAGLAGPAAAKGHRFAVIADPHLYDTDLGTELPPQLVVHAPALANPSFELSSGCGETEAAYPGLTFRVPECTDGRSWADLEGRVQSWLMEQGRALDVYF